MKVSFEIEGKIQPSKKAIRIAFRSARPKQFKMIKGLPVRLLVVFHGAYPRGTKKADKKEHVRDIKRMGIDLVQPVMEAMEGLGWESNAQVSLYIEKVLTANPKTSISFWEIPEEIQKQ